MGIASNMVDKDPSGNWLPSFVDRPPPGSGGHMETTVDVVPAELSRAANPCLQMGCLFPARGCIRKLFAANQYGMVKAHAVVIRARWQ